MKPNAILFVDIDDAQIPRYKYREAHFTAAKKMGMSCLTAALKGRQHTERLYIDSDDVFYLESLTQDVLQDLVAILQQTYRLRGILCYAGHASTYGQVGCIVAEVCRNIGLPNTSASAIATCNNKFLMRQALQKYGVRSIRHALCHTEEELYSQAKVIGYPLIAKPPFGAASVFIKKCRDWPELKAHYRAFTTHYDHSIYIDFMGNKQECFTLAGEKHINIPGKSLLLEEYLDGVEGTVECVISQNKIHPVLINEKLILTEKENTVLENLLICPPVSFSPVEQEQIRDYARACIQAVGLNYAIAHLEFRMTKDGPIVIEINPRLGGLFVNSSFRDIAGLDPYQLYLSILLQEQDIDTQISLAQQRATAAKQHYSMLAMYPDKSGHFQGIKNIEHMKNHPNVIECISQPTDYYINAETEEHYLLRCWAKVDDASDAYSLHQEMLEHVYPIINPTPKSSQDMQIANISARLMNEHYCHIPHFSELISRDSEEIKTFKDYWNELVLDQNFKDYTHRERRILRYYYHPDEENPLQLNRDNKYHSSVTYDIEYKKGSNQLSYVKETFITHPIMQHILATDIAILGDQLTKKHHYAIDIHQFRVKAQAGKDSPTTSGIHQDGQNWIFMHFIQSHNTEPVISEVHATAHEAPPLLHTAMEHFLETLAINDKRLYHRASSVRQVSPTNAAFRDLLLVTFRQLPK
ncbi:2OG-Fe dioxygenase family protein [Xenorhabdus griffiniae]|uniref:2OG-Fe dioxygenase family protein n=1 Tax=Xenorhabdus griffiniae TaxID=351672 RepID=UPI0030CD7992